MFGRHAEEQYDAQRLVTCAAVRPTWPGHCDGQRLSCSSPSEVEFPVRAAPTCAGMDTDATSLLMFAVTSDPCDAASLLATGRHTVAMLQYVIAVVSYIVGEDCQSSLLEAMRPPRKKCAWFCSRLLGGLAVQWRALISFRNCHRGSTAMR